MRRRRRHSRRWHYHPFHRVKSFHETNLCQSRAHCHECRTSLPFRQHLLRQKLVTSAEFPCPFGYDGNGLGTIIEAIVKPIGKWLGLKCLDPQTGALKPLSPCAKRRDKLNALKR